MIASDWHLLKILTRSLAFYIETGPPQGDSRATSPPKPEQSNPKPASRDSDTSAK